MPALERSTSKPAGLPQTPSSGPYPLTQAVYMTGAQTALVRNEEIFGEGEPADYVYKVVSGLVRAYKILSDGRRQIIAFYLPGEVFGLEAGGNYSFSAEAATPSQVLIIKQSTLLSRAATDCKVARDLWAITASQWQRSEAHVLLLIKNADERVATFLLDMADRGGPAPTIDLPMSRQDIADYLGLTIETVSRTFTRLEKLAIIDLPNSRRIVLRNRAMLKRLDS